MIYVHVRVMSGSMTFFCFFSSCNYFSSFLNNEVECTDPSTAQLPSPVSPSSRLISSVVVGGSIPMFGTSSPYIDWQWWVLYRPPGDRGVDVSYVGNNSEDAFRKGSEVYFCFQNSGSLKNKMNWLAFSCKHFKAPCSHILTDEWCKMITWTKPFGCN